MLPNIPKHLPQSLLYKKALEIFTLSRSISHYFIDDLNYIQKNGKENPSIYFTGDIMQQSVSLAPEILKAEKQSFSDEKYKYVASVTHLTNLLDKNCDRLEQTHSNGRDFLPILRNELIKFKKLQRTWMLSL